MSWIPPLVEQMSSSNPIEVKPTYEALETLKQLILALETKNTEKSDVLLETISKTFSEAEHSKDINIFAPTSSLDAINIVQEFSLNKKAIQLLNDHLLEKPKPYV